MSISFYQPPPVPADEPAREAAVEASGMLAARADPALGRALDDAARALRRRFGTRASLISTVHGDTQHVLAADGLPPGPYSRRLSFCGHAVAAGAEAPDGGAGATDLFCVPDLSADERFAGNPWVSGERGTLRFYAAALIRDAAQRPLGAVCVVDDRPRPGLMADEADALRDAARQVEARLGLADPAGGDAD